MDDNIVNFFKLQQINLEGKTPEELALLIIGRMEEDKKGLAKVLNAIFENQYYLHTIQSQIIELVIEKIMNKYGVSINCDELKEEARKDIDSNWGNIKKTIQELVEFNRLIDNSNLDQKE